MNTVEIFRRFESLIRIGSIANVDYEAKRVRAKSGALLTNWINWPAEVGQNFIRWRPLRVGTQVVLACPSGDPAQAVIVSMLYSSQLSSPSLDKNVDMIVFNDGTELNYDSKKHHLQINVRGSMTINCQDDFAVIAKNVRLN